MKNIKWLLDLFGKTSKFHKCGFQFLTVLERVPAKDGGSTNMDLYICAGCKTAKSMRDLDQLDPQFLAKLRELIEKKGFSLAT